MSSEAVGISEPAVAAATRERRAVRKVLAYVVRAGQLLVFTHRDVDIRRTGVQVPGGTVRDGEDLAAAVLREVAEETGCDSFEIVRYLGAFEYDMAPSRDEVQVRHVFELAPASGGVPCPERWEGAERHEGAGSPTVFEFFWLPLADAHVLAAGQGALVGRLAAGHAGDPDAPRLPQLTDGVVMLQPLHSSDAAEHQAGEDDELVRWLNGAPGTLDGTRAWIERNLGYWRAGGPIFNFGVREAASGRLVGNLEANLSGDLDGVAVGEANIAYGIFPFGRRNGYASRAVALACEYLRSIGVPAAVIRADERNEPSVRVAERAGFHYCGEVVTRDGDRLVCFRRQLTAAAPG